MLDFLLLLANEAPQAPPILERIGYSTLIGGGVAFLALFVRSEISKSERRITDHMKATYISSEKHEGFASSILHLREHVDVVENSVRERNDRIEKGFDRGHTEVLDALKKSHRNMHKLRNWQQDLIAVLYANKAIDTMPKIEPFE